MGLFDKVVSIIGDNISGSTESKGLLQQAINLIENPEVGGLSGLIEKFQNGGLGDVASSWVGKGDNLPVSGEQIRTVLGDDTIRGIAEKLGLSGVDASSSLAKLLPHVIDKLTPEGTVPEGGLLDKGLALLKGKILD
jgi:uncharacterized protein YidB (DUF937 family)